jgi:hypothetical protein
MYTDREDAMILAAYERCVQSRSLWSPKMSKLAVQLGRTENAVKTRCVQLQSKQKQQQARIQKANLLQMQQMQRVKEP